MKRYSGSILPRLLTPVALIFLAVTFLGCNDPEVSEMAAHSQEFKFFLEQELQRNRMAAQVFTQTSTLPPAQVADMAAERLELDRMIQRGEWRSFLPGQPASQPSRSLPRAQAVNMKDERRELDSMIQRGEWDTLLSNQPTSQPSDSPPPAQKVDMEAERRELDRMVERGDWQSLFN